MFGTLSNNDQISQSVKLGHRQVFLRRKRSLYSTRTTNFLKDNILCVCVCHCRLVLVAFLGPAQQSCRVSGPRIPLIHVENWLTLQHNTYD